MTVPINRLVRSRRKTIALVIERDGSLTVRAPLRLSEENIQAFVEKHATWVAKHKRLVLKHAPPPKKQYKDGEKFFFLGQLLPLRIVPRQRTALTLGEDGFRLAKSSLPKAEETFIRWYKAQARRILFQRVPELSTTHNIHYQKIRISSARTRWGSCSTKGTLSFTWRLVLTPPEVVDYVIIHELVHIQIKNHSKAFWERVGKYLPEYKQQVRWLRTNGKYLVL